VNSNTFAQDATFSQNFSNPLSLNPAYAGSLGCSRFVADYRNEFPLASSYDKNNFFSSCNNDVTYSASYDQYVDKLAGGLGLVFTSNNELNDNTYQKYNYKQNWINGIYAFNLRINDNFHIRPSINMGVGQNYFIIVDNGPPPGVIFSYPSPPISYPNTVSKAINYFNIGTGVLFACKNFISGIALDHINKPNIGLFSTSKLPMKLTIHSSLDIKITDNTNLTPGIIFQEQQFGNPDVNGFILASLMLKIWYIKLGFEFTNRTDNISGGNSYLIGMLGFVNKWMSIGYSYDYIIPDANNESPNKGRGGIHEIAAIFKFNCKNKEKYGLTHLYGF